MNFAPRIGGFGGVKTIKYQLAITNYNYPFRQPLKTSHGEWKIREGIIISLKDAEGNISYGEIAPLPNFGSETLKQAQKFCSQYSQGITETEINQIPEQFPACQFAFESALAGFSAAKINEDHLQLSCLLPPGKDALKQWQIGWEKGHQTFKWKIGVFSLQEELSWFEQLLNLLPDSTQIRLDANAGLTLAEAKQWLTLADACGKVEFLEQPLPPQQFPMMLELATTFSTPLALDESVGTLRQLETCYENGWRGIFVVKCAIAGSPRYLQQLCEQYFLDLVFSSAMETSIGRQAALQLAMKLSSRRALGFGVDHWF
ncbi:o-succinylbenzoate synthase [Dactylococcopsis salina]|uniref:o-succinylbenzoate synthase n=1 Tax=Dactylococcopsis salina TaxID=292566 RepID=UPI002FBD661B